MRLGANFVNPLSQSESQPPEATTAVNNNSNTARSQGQYHSLMSGGPVIDKDWNLSLGTEASELFLDPEATPSYRFFVVVVVGQGG